VLCVVVTYILSNPLLDALSKSKNILLAGCGGGYDVFSALPLYFALKNEKKNVFLSNLTFTSGGLLMNCKTKRFGLKEDPVCFEIFSDTPLQKQDARTSVEFNSYFPEQQLSQWFKVVEKERVPVYTFVRSGVKQQTAAYQQLAECLKLDTIVLVDGGTDSLMFGDEQALGTPGEDMLSIASVFAVKDVECKLLVCLGFGVDAHHGVSHGRFLENVAAMGKNGGYLGCFSLLREMEEVQKFTDAYNSCLPTNSIVCSSVVSAINNEFGNVHSKPTEERTGSGKLFINPLMCLYWSFKLQTVVQLNKYVGSSDFQQTSSYYKITDLIHSYREKEGLFSASGDFLGTRRHIIVPF